MIRTNDVNKKIDIIVKYFYPVAAGIETNVLETYSVLVENGWDVTIHTSNLDYTTGEILKEKEVVNDIKVIRYPLTFPSFKPKVPYNSTGLICLHNFDILPHLHILIKSLFYKLFGKKKYTLILTPHGGFNPEWRVFSKVETIIKYVYHYTLGVLLINTVVDGVRAVSDWEMKEMVSKGVKRNKISVISNGIEDEAFENITDAASKKIKGKVNSFGRYIIQIGRIYPIKNYETTIKALVNVPEDIKYVVVGPISDKKYLKRLKELIKSLDLSERVVFTGVIRGVDKYYVIKHALAMVHMAIWESFCNVVHEAMSQGLPVIAANNTALTFLIKNNINGFLVDTKSNEGVSKKINYILDLKNSEEIKKISEANIAFAENNTWAITAEKMNKLYISLSQN